jgi:hypothetical protein
MKVKTGRGFRREDLSVGGVELFGEDRCDVCQKTRGREPPHRCFVASRRGEKCLTCRRRKVKCGWDGEHNSGAENSPKKSTSAPRNENSMDKGEGSSAGPKKRKAEEESSAEPKTKKKKVARIAEEDREEVREEEPRSSGAPTDVLERAELFARNSGLSSGLAADELFMNIHDYAAAYLSLYRVDVENNRRIASRLGNIERSLRRIESSLASSEIPVDPPRPRPSPNHPIISIVRSEVERLEEEDEEMEEVEIGEEVGGGAAN